MKKLASFLIILITFSNCSFDNKTGIWEDASDVKKIKKEQLRLNKLEDVFVENKIFNEEKKVSLKKKIKIAQPLKNKNWSDIYFNLKNNIPNISYENKKYLISKSSSLSKSSVNSDFLFYDDNIISYDHKGRIYLYSLDQKEKVFEYYFYKTKFKKYKKKINIAAHNDVIYAADNLGYVYAIKINSGKLIWAKNFGIPFRSNIKVVNNSLFLADQDNKIYSLKTSNGEKLWEFSTSLTEVKSNFKNNIAVDEKNNNIFFLNTSGEIYSINYLNQQINWFLNLKNKNSSTDSFLFLSSLLTVKDENIIFSTGDFLFNYNSLSGKRVWKKNIPTNSDIILNKNNIFLFTKNNLLVCLDLSNGQVTWSKNIFNQIQILNKKLSKKIKQLSNIMLVNNEIFLFSSEGFLVSFNYQNGNINSVNRVTKTGLASRPIFAKGKMYLFNKNYRLFEYN